MPGNLALAGAEGLLPVLGARPYFSRHRPSVKCQSSTAIAPVPVVR
ncbi:hypothetical protein [Streptomyces sp. BRA346]